MRALLLLALASVPALGAPAKGLTPAVERTLALPASRWLPLLQSQAADPALGGTARLAIAALAARPGELERARPRAVRLLGEEGFEELASASRRLRREARLEAPLRQAWAELRKSEGRPALSEALETARLAAEEPGRALSERFDASLPRRALEDPDAVPGAEGRRAGVPLKPSGGRARLRELGVSIGRLPPGPLNAITDVAGVKVGHATVSRGRAPGAPGKGPARTGVTAVLPHGGDLWRERVPAAALAINGAGELTGMTWLNTQGALEVPVLLTNTMSVGAVQTGVVEWMLKTHPAIGVTDDVVIPVVGECDDSTLNDARGLHVKPGDAVRAIEAAKAGAVAEGAVGAGTGMVAFEFKAGIGTASRRLPRAEGGYTVGVLVNNNMGLAREHLTVAGVPVGREIADLRPAKPAEGSIIIVIATDAPLDHLKLSRLASKAALGLARTGAQSRHGSGDLVLAFSTGNRVPHEPAAKTYRLTVVPDNKLNPLFEAVQEAVEEAILNSLTAAETTTGRGGTVAHALPLDRLSAAMRRHRGGPPAPR